MLPIIVSLFTIAIILILSFVYKIYEDPFWIKEGGVIETLSALGYFLAAFLMIVKGEWAYIKKYYYFFMLVLLFGLRELDFDKRFTTMGIFKIKFYLSSSVPLSEKLMGLFVIAALLYIIFSIVKNHYKDFFLNIKKFSPVHIGSLVIFLLLLVSKTLDGLSRKLGDLGFVMDEQLGIYFEAIEEILELGIPLLMISTLLIYFSSESSSENSSKHSS